MSLSLRARPSRTAAALATLTAGALMLVGCAGDTPSDDRSDATTRTVTDMLDREVVVPQQVDRILALHPIPTTLIARLAPGAQVSVDTVYQNRYLTDTSLPVYPADRLAALTSLPVTNVYFKDPSAEQLLELDPDVIITMVGDPQVDERQNQLGIPTVAVSKSPIAAYEQTIRLVGQVVGNEKDADAMADFWRDTAAAVQAETDTVPEGERPTVMYTGQNGNLLVTPGSDTVFGTSIGQAGGKNLGDSLSGTDNESNEITVEQVIAWDPDVIIAASQEVKDQIMTLPEWAPLSAVSNDQVFVPPAYASMDGLTAIVGMVWAQGVLLHGDDADARAHLAEVMREYYTLYFGFDITDDQIAQVTP